MRKTFTLYQEDYTDLSWYAICKELGVINYEYDRKEKQDHNEIEEIDLTVIAVKAQGKG